MSTCVLANQVVCSIVVIDRPMCSLGSIPTLPKYILCAAQAECVALPQETSHVDRLDVHSCSLLTRFRCCYESSAQTPEMLPGSGTGCGYPVPGSALRHPWLFVCPRYLRCSDTHCSCSIPQISPINL